MDVVILLENNLPLGTSMARGVVATNILFRIRKQLFYQALFCFKLIAIHHPSAYSASMGLRRNVLQDTVCHKLQYC